MHSLSPSQAAIVRCVGDDGEEHSNLVKRQNAQQLKVHAQKLMQDGQCISPLGIRLIALLLNETRQ